MQLPRLFSTPSRLRNKASLRITIGLLSLLAPLTARAGPTGLGCAGPLNCLTQVKDGFDSFGGDRSLAGTVNIVISTFLSVLGIIFIGMILFAGYNWMTAMGDKEKVTRAKDTLVSALIGLILIIAAWSITSFVLTSLGTIR